MKDLKLYIEVVYSQDGSSMVRIVREYVNWLNNTEYNILAKYKNNFLGKFRAKRKLAKWKKYYKAHDFTENEYSIIEETIY